MKCGLNNNSKYENCEEFSKGEAYPTCSSSPTPKDES
jgi:hypothetical protein